MTSIPMRVGPSRLKDASLALLALPLLGVVLPFAVFYFTLCLGSGPGAGDDGDGRIWAFLGIGMIAGPVAALVASIVVVVRSWRSGYRFLTVAAAISPFGPAVLASGVLWR
ncbi:MULTISPECIES: hypothetical protein [Kitasatospora]|uniref:ABC transporter permease n=1 Tax=Kitasatospora cathayae TaxID=3004092 RepID=A0ABY7Q747_9ACTN|nr:hypothetical protein [Kitasatospora sp. HUAS 3-15]WBP88437.1 hypothetical protein O1G21_23080 [Kitasatospora sp. HUAS 3-15]